MGRKRRIRISFPLGGLNRRAAYRQSPPFSTPDCLNVRSMATLENRERGGSRPGLVKFSRDDLGANIRLLSPMVLAPGDGFTAWSDVFNGSSLAGVWTQASWATDVPQVLPSALVSVDTSVADAAAVRDALTIDTTEAYTVEMFIVPWNGAFHGKYQLYFRMNNSSPAYATEGVEVEIVMTGSAGAYSASLKSYTGGNETVVDTDTGTISSAQPAWLTATISGTTVTVYWNNTQILTGTADSHSGSRVGFGLECTVDGGLCLANVFRVQYYSTGTVTSLRSMLIASADGDIWKETPYGRMTKTTTALSVRDDVQLNAAQSGQKLYIADYGDLRVTGTDGAVSGTHLDAASVSDWTAKGISTNDDVVVITNVGGSTVAGTYDVVAVGADYVTLASAPGDGTCSYRIERAPKVYDPIADTLTPLQAASGKGQVPTGCPLIARHLGRIFLGGAEITPHVWYACRQNDETDCDYSQTDSQRAVAGTASMVGVPGQALTALVAHSDDYLILGCRNSIWRMRGDPAYSTSLDILSDAIGIVGSDAWCLGPEGELIFLSLDGVYVLPPSGDSFPISVSRELLPQELLNFDPNTTTVSLEYDVPGRGVHIFLSPESSNDQIHWWLDWENKTFWPMTLTSNHEPMATCSLPATAIEDAGVILGCRDGYLRRFNSYAERDDGTAFTSYVKIGPIALAADGRIGTLMGLDAELALYSGGATWEIHPSLTFESAAGSTATTLTGSWIAGINGTVHSGGRGQAFMLKLTGTTGRRWALEQIVAEIRESGRRRIA